MLRLNAPGVGKFALIGGFSGALYGLWQFGFLMSLGDSGVALPEGLTVASGEVGAGLFYGIVVGAALRRDLGLTRFSWLAYIIAASASCLAAIHAAIALYDYRGPEWVATAAGGAAGGLGALLLSGATALLSRRARDGGFVALTAAAGALCGLALPLALEADSLVAWIAFFALWQAAYAGAPAVALGLRAA